MTTHVENPNATGVDRKFALCGMAFPRSRSAGRVGWWTVRGRLMHQLLNYHSLSRYFGQTASLVADREPVTCVECQHAYTEHRLTRGAFT